MISKIGTALAAGMVYIAFIDLIPTILSSTVCGLCNVVARSINSLSSQVAELDYASMTFIKLSFCFSAIVAASFLQTKLPRFI